MIVESTVSPTLFLWKVVALCVVLAIDLGMNVVSDFEDATTLRGQPCTDTRECTILPIVFVALQLVLQVIAFIVVFLLLSATFLFRVGMLGRLSRRFRMVFIVSPVYTVATVAHGAFRVSRLSTGNTAGFVWQSAAQPLLYWLRMLVAVAYYAVHVHAVSSAADPQLYDREFWARSMSKRARAPPSSGW